MTKVNSWENCKKGKKMIEKNVAKSVKNCVCKGNRTRKIQKKKVILPLDGFKNLSYF